MSDAAPIIGVVVIGRNESARIASCLKSLAAYRGRIVYADSASTDGSADIAREQGAIVVEIDGSTPLTPARGRNEGFARLLERFPGCDFVQFVDGDGVVDPEWIEAGAAFLKAHEQAAVVCGQVLEAHPDTSVYNWLCGDEWKGAVGRIEACGGNAMVRVAALRQVGDFRDDLVAGEEAELLARMRARGWEVWRIDAPMVVHDADIQSFGEWWRRARRGGFAYANVWWLTRKGAEPLYAKQLRSSLFWVFGLPAVIALLSAAMRDPILLLLVPAAWALQTARIAARRGALRPGSWRYAGLIMLAKVAEAMGIMRYFSSMPRP